MGTGELLLGKKEWEQNIGEGKSKGKLLEKKCLDTSVFLSLIKLLLLL